MLSKATYKWAVGLSALVTATACAEPADLLLLGGQVWTGGATPSATAVAVRGGMIVAVGADADLVKLRGPETDVVDLAGRLVTPGFLDAHTHFVSGGFELSGVQLRDAVTPAEFTRRIRAHARAHPGEWMTGGTWDHENWGGALPRRDWIDSVTGDTPVFVARLDGHMAVANSRSLSLAGVTAATPDPPGGEIVRDSRGRPTGVLKDAAMSLVYDVIPDPSPAERDRALDAAVAHAVARGLTQVTDMGSWADLEAYRRARAGGRLPIRVYSAVPIATWERLAAYVAEHGLGDDRLRWGAVKGFVDGSLGSTTAWFYDPYLDQPGTSGLMITDTAALRQQILGADAAGLHVVVHAIGDRANDWLLDVFAAARAAHGERDRRFRIEHAQHLTDDAIRRIGEDGVIVSMQPFHAADDGRWAAKRIGPRIRSTYAFRSLLDRGALLAFGSDWTVAPLDPLLGVQAAVTRRTLDGLHPDGWVPEEKITLAEALVAYTRAGARAAWLEHRVGTIAVGMDADLVVFDANLFTMDPTVLDQARVDLTLVAGTVVFRRVP